MREIMAYFLSLSIVWLYQAAIGFPLVTVFERVGIPLGFALLFWVFFSKQIEKRHAEQREFWADNNKYLRQLIAEFRQANTCKFEK